MANSQRASGLCLTRCVVTAEEFCPSNARYYYLVLVSSSVSEQSKMSLKTQARLEGKRERHLMQNRTTYRTGLAMFPPPARRTRARSCLIPGPCVQDLAPGGRHQSVAAWMRGRGRGVGKSRSAKGATRSPSVSGKRKKACLRD